jgi:hypothetical protein
MPDDGLGVRWRKRAANAAARLAGISRRTRVVPVRLLARRTLEPRMVRLAEESWRDWQRFEIAGLEALQRAVLATESAVEVDRELEASVNDFVAKVKANVDATIDAGLHDLAFALDAAGPEGRRRPPRYSRIEPGIAEALARLGEDAEAWPERRHGAIAMLRFLATVEHAQHELVQDIVRDVAAPLDEGFTNVARLVEQARHRIEALPPAASVAGSDEEWERLALRARAILPKPASKELRAAEHLVRRATSTSAPMTGLLAFVDAGDAAVSMVPSLHAMTLAPRPASVATVRVDVRELKEVEIAQTVLPTVESVLSEVQEAFVQIRETVREAAHMVEQGFAAATLARTSNEDPQAFDDVNRRAAHLLASLEARSCDAWAHRRGEVLSAVARMSNRIFEAILARSSEIDPSSGSAPGERLWSRLRDAVRRTADRLERRLVGSIVAETGHDASELAHLYRVQAGIERLDAAAIRALIDRQAELRAACAGETYASWFSPEPVRDPRLFVVHRSALEDVVAAEGVWHRQPELGNAVLVVGASGSGKSSVLGLARLKVAARRVVVLRSAAETTGSIVDALADTLGTEPTPDAVRGALRHQRSVIMIDDLQEWLPPTPEGVQALASFVGLVGATQTSTFWIASMGAEAYEVWTAASDLGRAFAATPHLRAMEAPELERALLARQQLSGAAVAFPATLGARVAARLLNRSPQRSFFRALAAASHGSIRRALALWLAHAYPGPEASDRIEMRPIRALGWNLAFVRLLDPAERAGLGAVARHGSLSAAVLRRCLGGPPDHARHVVRFLLSAGLVEPVGSGDAIAVRKSIRDDVVRALADEGIVAGGIA